MKYAQCGLRRINFIIVLIFILKYIKNKPIPLVRRDTSKVVNVVCQNFRRTVLGLAIGQQLWNTFYWLANSECVMQIISRRHMMNY